MMWFMVTGSGGEAPTLTCDLNLGPHLRPLVQPLHITVAHVDAAVALWLPKIVVPVGAVNVITQVFGREVQVPFGIGVAPI